MKQKNHFSIKIIYVKIIIVKLIMIIIAKCNSLIEMKVMKRNKTKERNESHFPYKEDMSEEEIVHYFCF